MARPDRDSMDRPTKKSFFKDPNTKRFKQMLIYFRMLAVILFKIFLLKKKKDICIRNSRMGELVSRHVTKHHFLQKNLTTFKYSA